ncbi:hypothetical protein EAO69_41190 [Streptomyces sp. me109]|nr:hypothetical protein EAO69_41190 [Streptomyces sp. me109]
MWADPVVPDASGSVRAVENPRYPTTARRTPGGRGAGHRLADVQPVARRLHLSFGHGHRVLPRAATAVLPVAGGALVFLTARRLRPRRGR